MIDKKDFAQKFAELRNKCGLSQSKLADMLYISGQAVSKWENESSLPDIELLLPLSQILGVSVDYLLGNNRSDFVNNSEAVKESVTAYDISDENISLLSVMSNSLSREYLYKAAKYIEKDMFDYNISLELTSNIDNIKNYYKREVDLRTLEKDALMPFAKLLSNLTLQAINSEYNPVQEIIKLMKCPDCGKDFEYFKTSADEYISCGEHRFEINEGVIDFKTFEIPGYTWSSWYRRYEDYKNQICPDITEPNINNLTELDKNIVLELQKNKPPVILEIGSGAAYGVRKFMKFIDWECTIILTDLSHRILKYDKRYIDENSINPQVKLVYLACDVRNLPFKDDVLPCILSYGGYDGIDYKFKDAFIESRRVLKTGAKVITNLGIISDRENENVQKWLKLIQKEIGHDFDMMDLYYRSIFDVKEWHGLLKEFGFKDFTFIKISDEIQVPETDVFPYNSEISRWMGGAFIAAVK
jgi:transcriptional regulator with XRE-family HTH domain/ubiquinone/menaquinone biosynthesis C-methylase UbiE